MCKHQRHFAFWQQRQTSLPPHEMDGNKDKPHYNKNSQDFVTVLAKYRPPEPESCLENRDTERCSSFFRFRTERCVLEAKTCESHSGALRTLVENLNLRRIKPQDLPQPFLHGDITPPEWLRERHTTGAQNKFSNYEREQPLLGSSSRFHRIEPSPYFNVVQTRLCAKDLGFARKNVFGC